MAASDRTLKAKAFLSDASFQASGSLSTSLRGVGIASIAKTSTEGLVDTYTITYTDGRTQTYTVTNGAQGERGPRGDKGPRGYTGFSAYDYAVNGGYEGTEEEFTQLMASNATMAETVEYYSWTEEIKAALLACLEKVAWVDADGQTYYDALYAALYDRVWTIENNLTGCRNTNTMTAITKGRPYNGILEALGAYTMEGATVSITMGGVDVTAEVYEDGTISIPAVTGAVVITAEAVRTAWSVTNVLTNVTSDNPAEWVAFGESYEATLTPDVADYDIVASITMGGIDVTGTSYSSGTISIPHVTGDVVITAVAGRYHYDLSDLTMVGGTIGTELVNYGDIAMNVSATQLTRRRAFVLTEGTKPIKISETGGTDPSAYTDSAYYPIPIPVNANGCKVQITPTSQISAVRFWTYSNGSYANPYSLYFADCDRGYLESYIEPGAYQYITIISKYDATGTSYPTEPSALTVDFVTDMVNYDALPTGYTRVDYLTKGANTYDAIETGLYQSPTFAVLDCDFEFAMTGDPSANEQGFGARLSSGATTATSEYAIFFGRSGVGAFRSTIMGSDSLTDVGSYSRNTWRKAKYRYNGGAPYFVIDGSDPVSMPNPPATIDANATVPLRLCGINNNNATPTNTAKSTGYGRWGKVVYYDANRNVIYYFVPAYNGSRYGYYENVHGVWYPSIRGVITGGNL